MNESADFVNFQWAVNRTPTLQGSCVDIHTRLFKTHALHMADRSCMLKGSCGSLEAL